ncbi:hypothetical protein CWO90_25410 [Bradyrhizobium sp. Leo121]|nr:hypothetical protein CWO90_25410 [Bradyrhizobium sp. Leo121]
MTWIKETERHIAVQIRQLSNSPASQPASPVRYFEVAATDTGRGKRASAAFARGALIDQHKIRSRHQPDAASRPRNRRAGPNSF